MSNASSPQDIELSLLAKGKKVIPLVYEYESLFIADIKLPDLVVSNRQSTPVTPVEIQILATANGRKVTASFLGQDQLASLINQANSYFKNLLTDASPDTRRRLAIGCGDINIDAASLSDDATIGPGQCAAILLSQALRCFHVVGVTRIDTIEIIMSLKQKGSVTTTALKTPLHFHKTDVRYVFPIRGNVTLQNMPMNYPRHRQAHSQEFAFDVITELPSAQGDPMYSCKGNSSDLSDYHIYRREILAVADGAVVELGDSFPEEESVNPEDWTQAQSSAVMERLACRIGLQNALCGNYITIEHAPDEFSFYGHLSQGSIRVRVGDKVKAGQVIALVGSTGNSTEPHLHFQVMDSRDMFTANGLPVRFEDVPADKMNQSLTSANTISVSDYLHLFLPKIGNSD